MLAPDHRQIMTSALAELGWVEGEHFTFDDTRIAVVGPLAASDEAHDILYHAALIAGAAIEPDDPALCLKHSKRGLVGPCEGMTKRRALLDLMSGVEWCGHQRWS